MPCLGNCLSSSSAKVDLRKDARKELSDEPEESFAKPKSYKKFRNSFFGENHQNQEATSVYLDVKPEEGCKKKLKAGKNKKDKKICKKDAKLDKSLQETHPKMRYMSEKVEGNRNEIEDEPFNVEMIEPLMSPESRETRTRRDATRFEIENEDSLANPLPSMDFNLYAAKKNISQGLIDIALLSANFSQLKYILSRSPKIEFSFEKWSKILNIASLALVCFSILLQILVGVCLLLSARLNLNNDGRKQRAELCNTLIIICVFIITVINIFIVIFLDGYEDFELI